MGRITNKQWSRVTIDFPTRLRKKEMYWKKQHWPGASMTKGTLLMVKRLDPTLSKNIDTTDSRVQLFLDFNLCMLRWSNARSF